MGDIQLGLFDRKGILEVEVIRARGLLPKPGSKILPGKLNFGQWKIFYCKKESCFALLSTHGGTSSVKKVLQLNSSKTRKKVLSRGCIRTLFCTLSFCTCNLLLQMACMQRHKIHK